MPGYPPRRSSSISSPDSGPCWRSPPESKAVRSRQGRIGHDDGIRGNRRSPPRPRSVCALPDPASVLAPSCTHRAADGRLDHVLSTRHFGIVAGRKNSYDHCQRGTRDKTGRPRHERDRPFRHRNRQGMSGGPYRRSLKLLSGGWLPHGDGASEGCPVLAADMGRGPSKFLPEDSFTAPYLSFPADGGGSPGLRRTPLPVPVRTGSRDPR